MAKHYDYVLSLWLKLKATADAEQIETELQEYLERNYLVTNLKLIEDDDDASEAEFVFSMRLQTSFNESQMGDEYYPSDEAVGEFEREMEEYLEAGFHVTYLDIDETALTSYLLAEWDDEDTETQSPAQGK